MAPRRTTRKRSSSTPKDRPPSRAHRIRMRVGFWFLLVLFGAVAARLAQLQTSPDFMITEEERLHIAHSCLKIPRGDILDRDGTVLATDRRVKTLSVDPRKVDDPRRLAADLARRLQLDERYVLEQLTKRRDSGGLMKSVFVKRWLTREDLEALGDVEELGDGALMLEDESTRSYPEGQLAAHILGFVNREGVGSGGVELSYNHRLSSTQGYRKARVDLKRRMLTSRTLDYTAPSGGANVHLTIDSVIQHKLEQELEQRLIDTKAPRGAGIVMDPKTGSILALACFPTYDPNRYMDYSDEERKNTAVVDVFEPGSSFKIVAASAALEHQFITLDTMIDCENGAFNPYGHRVTDFHKLGVEPFTHCFAESSNIAMIKVGAMLGEERMEEWIRRFGFDSRTSSDFGSAESKGIFHGRKHWSRLSMGSLPMGHEIAVTLPQLARAFSVIANGGFLVEPYFVDRVIGRDGGEEYRHDQTPPQRILSERTAAQMRELCHLVVTEGTGGQASIPEYRVGGKTGTAEMIRKDGRGYDRGKCTAVFAGFAPVSDPRVTAVIVVYEPRIKLHYGGYVCGPVFREVVREALIRLNCPEDPVKDASPTKVAAAHGDPDMVPANFAPEAASTEEDWAPLDGLELLKAVEDSISTGDRLPDFSGMTKRQARAEIASLGLPWDPRGSGWVIKQEPPAGTPLDDVSLCRLTFSNKRDMEEHEAEPPARGT